MDKKERLIRLYTRVYSRPGSVALLKLLGTLAVVYVILSFSAVNVTLLLSGEYLECVKLCTVAAIPFLAVSAMRLLLNVPRPYETVDFPPFEAMKGERKAGKSFPSRHVFSAVLLGTLTLAHSIPLGIMTLVIGVFIGVERVLLGIHFTRDAVVGGIMGVLSGVIGILFL